MLYIFAFDLFFFRAVGISSPRRCCVAFELQGNFDKKNVAVQKFKIDNNKTSVYNLSLFQYLRIFQVIMILDKFKCVLYMHI